MLWPAVCPDAGRNAFGCGDVRLKSIVEINLSILIAIQMSSLIAVLRSLANGKQILKTKKTKNNESIN